MRRQLLNKVSSKWNRQNHYVFNNKLVIKVRNTVDLDIILIIHSSESQLQ